MAEEWIAICKSLSWALLPVIALMTTAHGADGVRHADPAIRRQAVLDIARTRPADGIEALAGALTDDNAVVRRAAARGLRAYGEAAAGPLSAALRHTDTEIALLAFQTLREWNRLDAAAFETALSASDNLALRLQAVQLLAAQPEFESLRLLLEKANRDSSDLVREIAARRLYPFPFHRDAKSIREHADQVVHVVSDIALPWNGWKLDFDPQQFGHTQGWFEPGFDDTAWTDVEIGKFWDEFGFTHRQGIGWYRGTFDLPDRPDHHAAELVFETVAGSAWVWINGAYAGQHLSGVDDWQVPFRVDATPFVRWGGGNQVTVRVLNIGRAGGICKPVRLEVMKLGTP